MYVDIRIAIWNANGLSNHYNEISVFLRIHNIDIMLISETHFTKKSYVYIKGYEVIKANHPSDKAHGGAAVIIKNTLKYKQLDSINLVNIQAAAIQIKCMHIDVSIAAVYLPPRYVFKVDNYKTFFQSLGNHFIAGGDYNAKHPWWGSRITNPKGTELFKCISQFKYSTLSTGKPTYWPSDPQKRPDLLDFIVYKGVSQQVLHIEENFDLSSDHSPIIVTYGATVPSKQKPYKIISKNTNIVAFKNWIENRISLDMPLKASDEIDLAVDKFTNTIHEAGFLLTSESSRNYVKKPFLPIEIRRLVKEKRMQRKIWQTSRSPYDKRILNKVTKDLKSKLREIKDQKTADYLRNLDPYANNSEHNLWKATKYLKRPTRRTTVIEDSNGHRCRENKEKAEAFAQHLQSVFQPNLIPNNENTTQVHNFLDSPCQLSLPIRKTSIKEVANEIKQIKLKKSPGFDKIDGLTIKNLPPKCIRLLTYIYNAMLRLNHFPSQWKCAEVIMIPKPNKPEHCPSSYRPISLLVTFSKVFEKILLRRMLPVLEDCDIIPEHQFGFRRGHGTPEQCHRIVQIIKNAFEYKQYCTAVFLDIKQAFDKVWHPGLLYKIKNWLPAPYYLIIKSYLSGRTFYVHEKDESSELYSINAGVPQGSVLGPVLYTIFTADLPINSNIDAATYADDTAFIATNCNRNDASLHLQQQLNMVEKWLMNWKMEVNTQKSVQITFTLRTGNCPPVSLNGSTIPESETVKYLGVHLDRRMTWKTHIKAKQKQLKFKTKKMYWLLGLRSQLSLENKVLLYKAILKPVWTYAIQLWGTASNSNIEILQRYQAMTLRSIVGAPWYITNFEIHKDLNVPYVRNEITKASRRYLDRLSYHENLLARNLLHNSMDVKRLKKIHILDLPNRFEET